MTGLQEAFRGIRRALDAAGVPFAIGRSWASTAYGEPRQTNDLDLVARFDAATLSAFLESLGGGYHFDQQSAERSLRIGRPFNVIDIRHAYKFDFFPVRGAHGESELERRALIPIPALDDAPVPVVRPEDIVLAKLRWYRQGGEVSTQQWRDILGVLRSEGDRLDLPYLESWAADLGVVGLYRQALDEARRSLG